MFIELFDEGEKASIYSYRIDEGDLEFEKFIFSFIDSKEYVKDYEIINDFIDRVLSNGAEERYFRPEGKIRDLLYALPQKGFDCKIRLFCLRVSNSIIILGNGGVKNTKTYQEDDFLNSIAEEMQKISEKILYLKKKGSLICYESEFDFRS